MVHYPEKRFYPRNSCKLPATIEEVEDNFLYRARLVNYSHTGIFVETDVVLESGTEIVVGIEDSLFPFQPSAGKPEGIDAPECYRARVIWQKGIEDSIFNYGYGAQIIFEEGKKSSRNGDLAEKPDLREHPRKPYSKVALFTSGKQFYKGFIKNISRRGVFVETKGDFSIGQIIKMVIPGTSIDNGVMLKGEFIRDNQTGIGVEFKSLLRKKGTIQEQDGRRSGSDRRRQIFSAYLPDKRSGGDRRAGSDRRKLTKT
jgi:Tfp pilus assembly protein PilZ